MTETDARYAHAIGDDEDGCIACQVDDLLADALVIGCKNAEPDGDEPELCAFCSHTIERLA